MWVISETTDDLLRTNSKDLRNSLSRDTRRTMDLLVLFLTRGEISSLAVEIRFGEGSKIFFVHF